MAFSRVARGRGFGQWLAAGIANAKHWEISPSFRMGERVVARMKAGKPQNSAIFRVWHGSCDVVCIPGMVPRDSKKHQGDLLMYAIETGNRLFAAAFSILVSAAFFAYAIVPATPGLVA
jgi:hypothetical protein